MQWIVIYEIDTNWIKNFYNGLCYMKLIQMEFKSVEMDYGIWNMQTEFKSVAMNSGIWDRYKLNLRVLPQSLATLLNSVFLSFVYHNPLQHF